MRLQSKKTENEFRTTVLCVDSYDSRVPAGRLSNPFVEGEIPFLGVMQLLLEMEKLLDSMGFPEPFAKTRSFSTARAERGAQHPGAGSARKGALATFNLRILFRQNASWQGSIQWLEGRQEESFRSVLELLTLMDSALSAGE